MLLQPSSGGILSPSFRAREFRVIPSGVDWINCARGKLGEFRGRQLQMLGAVPLPIERKCWSRWHTLMGLTSGVNAATRGVAVASPRPPLWKRSQLVLGLRQVCAIPPSTVSDNVCLRDRAVVDTNKIALLLENQLFPTGKRNYAEEHCLNIHESTCAECQIEDLEFWFSNVLLSLVKTCQLSRTRR